MATKQNIECKRVAQKIGRIGTSNASSHTRSVACMRWYFMFANDCLLYGLLGAPKGGQRGSVWFATLRHPGAEIASSSMGY